VCRRTVCRRTARTVRCGGGRQPGHSRPCRATPQASRHTTTSARAPRIRATYSGSTTRSTYAESPVVWALWLLCPRRRPGRGGRDARNGRGPGARSRARSAPTARLHPRGHDQCERHEESTKSTLRADERLRCHCWDRGGAFSAQSFIWRRDLLRRDFRSGSRALRLTLRSLHQRARALGSALRRRGSAQMPRGAWR
jgi:hypothetical protein